jgi:hypothetical protein
MQTKNIKSHKEISQQPTKSSQNPARKSHYEKSAPARIRKKKQTSFTVNARKKRRSALITNTVAGNEGNLKLHAQPTTLASKA